MVGEFVGARRLEHAMHKVRMVENPLQQHGGPVSSVFLQPTEPSKVGVIVPFLCKAQLSWKLQSHPLVL